MPPNNITAVMVRTQPGADINLVAEKILLRGPDLSTISNPNLYRTFQSRLGEMARAYLGMMTLAWVISLLILGVIFSVAANERRREVAVLFAVGSGRSFVLRLLLAEALLLALGGGTVGVLVGIVSVYLLQGAISGLLGMPLQLPPASESLPVVGGGLVLALIGVTVAALFPALRVSRQEPAQAMRE